MRLSVVVPSYRRPEALAACLDALGRQRRPPDEVVVVGRAGDADTAAAVASARGRGAAARLVHVRRPGQVAALNAGLDAATGDVVAFTDDDAVPREDWLERIEAHFAADPSLAGVGGRDVIAGEDGTGSGRPVGVVQWFGRVIGDHHRGAGRARPVDVLKGVNMAFRAAAIGGVRFDQRLRGSGAQVHNDLAFSLALRRRGARLVYDPAISVDHRPAERFDEDARAGRSLRALADAAHNETLALLDFLPRRRRAAFALWAALAGSAQAPGLLKTLQLLPARGTGALAELRAAWGGRSEGLRTWRRERRDASPQLLVVVHSAVLADRADALYGDREDARIVVAGPGAAGARRAVRAVLSRRWRVVYLVDVGASTTAAAVAARLAGARVVIDTGDLAHELARSVGERSAIGLAFVWAGERLVLALASHVVVRGQAHLELVPGPATHIPDLAPAGVGPRSGDDARRHAGVAPDAFVVGLVGSLTWAPRLGTVYGWDLIEALAHTPGHVHALIVGDGSGRARLERRAAELGVAARAHFAGRVPPAEVAEWVGAMDVGLSTQTADAVGSVRTTGKLPLYLACGVPVLASDVGEARRLLGPLGWTVPYRGVVDDGYPLRLAEAIVRWSADPHAMEGRREAARRLAQEHFDRGEMRRRAAAVVGSLLAARTGRASRENRSGRARVLTALARAGIAPPLDRLVLRPARLLARRVGRGVRPLDTAAYYLNEALALRGGRREGRIVTGSPILLDLRDRCHGDIYIYGTYEESTTALLQRIFEPGWTVLDVGAHAGYFSLLARDLGATLVHAFEPNPELATMLAESLRRARADETVVLVPKACGRAQGSARVQPSPETRNLGLATVVTEPGRSPTGIEVVTLDDHCAAHGLRPDLVKIDVEGFEADVVAGMRGLLANREPRYVICEVGRGEGRPDPDALVAEVTACGYRAERIGPDGRPQPLGRLDFAEVLFTRM